jgi:hypothetical protein
MDRSQTDDFFQEKPLRPAGLKNRKEVKNDNRISGANFDFFQ